VVSLIASAVSNAGRLMKGVMEGKENHEMFQGIVLQERFELSTSRVGAKFYPLNLLACFQNIESCVKCR